MVASFLLLMNIIITMQGMEQVPNFMLNLENCNEDLKLNQSKEISQQCLLKRVLRKLQFSSVQFSPQSCPKLCNPMNHSMPGLPVHHQILECTKTHVHRVSDAIQPSHPVVPFSSCSQSLPASESFPMSQLFARDGQSTGVSASASFLPINTQD